MAASIYAMEAMTYTTAGLIDRGLEDYMLETAMLKVYTTEALWAVVNDAFQIYGGAAYFTDQPLERMLRDARINQIDEGANDVLRSFIALVGMRGPGTQLREVWEALHHPWTELGKVWRYGLQRADAAICMPEVPVNSASLQGYALELSCLIKLFSNAVRRSLIKHGEAIFDYQYVQARMSEVAMELFAYACVLSRWGSELEEQDESDRTWRAGHAAGAYALKASPRRVRQLLAELRDNDDQAMTEAANAILSLWDAG